MKKGIFIAIVIAIIVVAVLTGRSWIKKKIEEREKALKATLAADAEYRAKNASSFVGGAIFIPDPNKDKTPVEPTGTSSLVRRYVS